MAAWAPSSKVRHLARRDGACDKHHSGSNKQCRCAAAELALALLYTHRTRQVSVPNSQPGVNDCSFFKSDRILTKPIRG